MKETKQAKENVEKFRKTEGEDNYNYNPHEEAENVCLEHKQTCQRWLDFEEKWHDSEGTEGCECKLCKELSKKIKDLKQVIKLYSDAGI